MGTNFEKYNALKRRLNKKMVEIEGIRSEIKELSEKNPDLLITDEELNSFEERYLGSWTYFFETNKTEWSSELFEIFELDERKIKDVFSAYLSFLTDEVKNELFGYIEAIKNGSDGYSFEHVIQTASGQIKRLLCQGFPIKDVENNIIGIKGIVEFRTKKLIDSAGLSTFFDSSVDLQAIANGMGYFIKVSPSWSELMGYTEMELCTQPFINFVHPDDLEMTIQETSKLSAGNLSLQFQNRYITKDGRIVFLSWNSQLDPVTGLFYCTARNVTDEVKQREKLLTDLSEKEVLLREIHHRVKNNLQVISSLLSLQSNLKKVNPSVKKLYEDSQNRIKSMAAIHELFYRSEALGKVNFREYIEKLVVDLIYSFQGEKADVQLKAEVENIWLNLDYAVPLGLIVNEIVTNSLKHGFQDKHKGVITITMVESPHDKIQLCIGDDGIGFPNALMEDRHDSLGMILITSLIDQIDGEIKQAPSELGTYYEINFMLNN